MRIHVTPRAGLSVRDPLHPERGHLPPEGQYVEDGSAWRRLAKAGDVIIAKEKPAARASASSTRPAERK
ncbi:MAG: DUF2635 domain-containing protein [Hyphomicrobiaceae bacterium]